MIRGTTAQFKFELPYDVSELILVKITFWQPGNPGPSESRPLPIIKVLEQCITTDRPDELLVFLNKEETLRFSEERKAYVQIQGKVVDGSTFASKKEMITVYPIYDDSILGDEILPTPTPDGLIFLTGSVIK